MSSFDPGFDFAAASAELLAKASLRAPHRPLGSAAETAMPASMVLSRILVYSSGLKFCLFAMTTSYSLLTHKLYQTSMVRWPQMSAMGQKLDSMATSANVRFVPTQKSARRQSSHNCAEKLSDTGGESHRQGTQNVTRAVARRTFAPPALAPIAPRRARKPKDATDTTGTSALAGDMTTMSKGMAAPTENVAADVRARAQDVQR